MKFKIQRFAWCIVFIAIATGATAAADNKTSAEKAREAIGILQSGAPGGEKALACKRLAVYGNADSVPALAALLSDEQLASWARIALEAIPGRAADDALRNAMGKLQGKLLVGVINSIGVRHDAKAVGGLADKLKDADVEVASAAAVTLGKIGGEPASKALEKALGNSTGDLRSAVGQGCILCAEHYLAEKKSAQAIKLYDKLRKADLPKQRILEATRGAILARQAEGLPLLLEALRATDPGSFGIGLRTARELPGRAVSQALAAELAKASPDRQGPLLLALADRSDDAVMPAILATAKSGSKQLRLVAIEVLVRLGNVACVPVLLDTLAENDAELALAAKAGLAALTGKEVDDQITARLSRGAGNTRRALVELAGQRQLTASVPDLIKAASDPDPAIRAAGIKALGETASIGELGALTALLSQAKSDDEVADVQAALESACTRIPDKNGCVDRLIPHVANSSVSAKGALLRVLGVTGTPKALAAVRSSVANPQPAVRDAAIRVLADWTDATALPALLDVFRTTEDESHRFAVLRGCVRLLEVSDQPVAEKVRTFTELIARTQRVDDRKVILSGLANLADPAALKLVEPLLADTQVQAEAELAALNIAAGIAKTSPAEAKAVATKLQAESKNQGTRDRAAKILSQIK